MRRILARILPAILLSVFLPQAAGAQSDRTLIRQGNRSYRAQKWTDAETRYRKAVARNPDNAQATYNLGCALLAQQKDSAAMELFQKAAQMEKAPVRKAKAYHNMGVVCQNHQQYAQAIQAYEMALRNNPHDNETRYNLALCKRQLKNQKDNNKKQNQNGKSKQDQNGKNKQDQNGKSKQDRKGKNNQDDQQQQGRQPKGQMSRENAEQLLNAAVQQEEATKQRMKKAARQSGRRQLEKNW